MKKKKNKFALKALEKTIFNKLQGIHDLEINNDKD